MLIIELPPTTSFSVGVSTPTPKLPECVIIALGDSNILNMIPPFPLFPLSAIIYDVDGDESSPPVIVPISLLTRHPFVSVKHTLFVYIPPSTIIAVGVCGRPDVSTTECLPTVIELKCTDEPSSNFLATSE